MDLTVEFGIYFSRVSDFISVWILFSSDIGAVAAEASEFKEWEGGWGRVLKHSHVDDDDDDNGDDIFDNGLTGSR